MTNPNSNPNASTEAAQQLANDALAAGGIVDVAQWTDAPTVDRNVI
jgi:hypothetical protein